MFLSLTIIVAASTIALAEDIFKAQYVSGKSGFDKKFDGELVVGDRALTMMDKDKAIFAIPLVNITKVSNTVEKSTGAIGRKLVFGRFAEHSEGFVFINTESSEAAEGIVFRVDKKMPTGVMAKIEFAVKKAKANEPPK